MSASVGACAAMFCALLGSQTVYAQTPLKLASADSSAKPAPSCDTARFRLVLDVGHTTEDSGAMSSYGFTEFSFNLRLAKELQKKLEETGFHKITMLVMEGPGKRSLYRRMTLANSVAADLFLSIHHDAVPDNFVERWTEDGATRNFSDRFKGHSIFVSAGNRHFHESVQFAKLLGEQMRSQGLHHTPHYTEAFMGKNRHPYLDAVNGVYAYDNLHVLRTSRAPAVLLEAGSIVNRSEELELLSSERRAHIVSAVVQAIEHYCSIHAPESTPLIASVARKAARKRTAHAAPRSATTAPSNY